MSFVVGSSPTRSPTTCDKVIRAVATQLGGRDTTLREVTVRVGLGIAATEEWAEVRGIWSATAAGTGTIGHR